MPNDEAPTLMEEMMTAANIKPSPSPPPSQKIDDASFGSGFKAGFLTSSSSPGTKRRSSSSTQSPPRFPLPSLSSTSASPAPLAAGLIEKLSSSPTLRTALENPRFRDILAELGRNPQATLARYQYDSAAMGFLKELMGALGDHFENLGKQQQEEGKEKTKPAAGPLVQAALEKQATQQKIRPVNNLQQDKAEQESVNNILRDPELRELLLDPQMQRVLQNCAAGSDDSSSRSSTSTGGLSLQQYMRDPATAAKLHKLAEAGLIQITR